MKLWLRYLVAVVVGGHGFIYLRFGMGGLPEALKEWRGISWVLGDTLTGERLKTLAFGLSLLAGIATVATGAAVAFSGSLHGLWRPLAMIGAAFGVLFFASFWDGQTERLVDQGAIGVAVSALLLASALLFPRAFG
jgi:hypothetical protein